MTGKMTKTEKELRRALFVSLRFYQHPVKATKLARYRLPWSVWKSLVRHNLICQTNAGLVTLSDHGLIVAKRLFPSSAAQLSTLKRTVNIRAEFGFVFLSRFSVTGHQVDAYYFDENGHETLSEEQRLFVPEAYWQSRKYYETQFQVKGSRTSKLVPIAAMPVEDDERAEVDYSAMLAQLDN